MTSSYGSACPVARTLDVIGERWTLLILRDLLLDGPRRFQDFRQSLRAIPPTTLSARLKSLEAAGVVRRESYSEHPPRMVYCLTAKGRELAPVLKALKRWGDKHGPANGGLPSTAQKRQD